MANICKKCIHDGVCFMQRECVRECVQFETVDDFIPSFNLPRILDACCGGRMFWFNKSHPSVVFMDNREFEEDLCNGQHFVVRPDVIGDFREMPFDDNSFELVVFDPPHLLRKKKKSWLAKKYGRLNKDSWREDITKGFTECFRVLKKGGVLVFKWNEEDIRVSEIINCSPVKPLFGHRSGKFHKTQWLVFMKGVTTP